MARVVASTSSTVAAAPERVLETLRDYQSARAGILTDNYSAYRVQQGGAGEGTVFSYHFAAGGRERDYRLRVSESPGTIREADELSSFVTIWTVAAAAEGSVVTLESSWNGAGGIGGLFEGLFAPIGLRRIQAQVLARLAAAIGG